MAIITLPTSFRPAEFSFGQLRFDTIERSDSTGAEAARLLGPPRWTCAITSAEHMTLAEAGAWEAWALKLRGRVNVAAIYDPLRQAPEGTLRGSPVIGYAVAAGATTATLGGATVGDTLKAGDVLQIGTGVGTSQLVKLVEDATATAVVAATWSTSAPATATWSGSGGTATWSQYGVPADQIIITFEPPLRIDFAKDTAVTWDKPVAYYRMQGSPKWRYSTQARRRQGGFAMDMVETFS